MNYTFRPLGLWTEPETKPRRSSGVFRAGWAATLDLPGHELKQLDARNVVIQVDCAEGDLRRDGMPKTNARIGHPGVRISFDSKHGPLTYATDAYEQQWSGNLPSWQANVRAIALGLEVLRAVDRYGVTRRGEQYRGWNALPPGSGIPMPAAMTVEEAARLILTTAGWDITDGLVDQVIHDDRFRTELHRLAVRRAHPDLGGNAADFTRLQEARQLLDQHRGA